MKAKTYTDAVGELNEELRRERELNAELLEALKLLYATPYPFASPENGGLGLEYTAENASCVEWERRKEVAEQVARAAIAKASGSAQ